jgi:hypothetical protein
MTPAHQHGRRACAAACGTLLTLTLSLDGLAAPSVAGPFLPDGGPSPAGSDAGAAGHPDTRKAAMSEDYAAHALDLTRSAPRPAAVAADGRARPRWVRVIHLTAVAGEDGAVDLGPQGPSVGDLFAFTDIEMRGDREVGHSAVACTTTSLDRGESHCDATIVLEDRGTIEVAGIVPDAGPPFEVAVTGGTDAFAGVGGALVVRADRHRAEALALTLRLRR